MLFTPRTGSCRALSKGSHNTWESRDYPQKAPDCLIPFIWNIQKGEPKTKSRWGAARAGGLEGGNREWQLNIGMCYLLGAIKIR
jgi:hypothetical protein